MKFIFLSLFFTSIAFGQQTIKDLTVNDLKVVNTKQGSKPCPLMTETQRNAIASPQNGRCVYNTTTSKLNVYNGTLWKAAGGGVDSWQTATIYAIDDLVIQSNKIYLCLTAHTSGVFATDLAALNWVEISGQAAVNLTGPITSIGAATSIASQTGTGSTIVVQNSPTLTTPNIGAATGTSLTLAGNISAYNYDKDNLLINGNVENPLSSEWTCTVGTCTRTTVSGEFSKDSAALKVALSSQAMNVSQTVNTPAGIQKQGYIQALYRVPATFTDFTICSLVDSVEQFCLNTNQLIKNDTFQVAKLPLTFGSTSAGIKFKTTSTFTGSAYFDAAILAQGLETSVLQGDTVYSASISSTGVVSNENKDWLTAGPFTPSGSSEYAITFNSGIFNNTPNCWTTQNQGSDAIASIQVPATKDGITVRTTNASTTVSANAAFILSCQKSGNDYLLASSSAYLSQNGNTDPASFTPTLTGGSSFALEGAFWWREGKYLKLRATGTITTPSGAAFSIALPNNYTIDASMDSSTTDTVSVGQMYRLTGTVTNAYPTTTYGPFPAFTDTAISNNLIYFARDQSGSRFGKGAGTTFFATGERFRIEASVPILGWTNSNITVASFENVPTVPSAIRRTDTFSVSYGTTNATTVCSANPCSYVDQIGGAVSSIPRASAGNYSLSFPKTYVQVKCTAGLTIPGSANTPNAFTCANCNSLAFYSQVYNTGVSTDSYGTLHCVGSY